MEPSHSQMVGAAEECHSCESGWTMYLGSPTHDDDIGDHSDDDEEQGGGGGGDRKAGDAEDESDDSMASDASSGPSHHIGCPWGNSKGNQLVKEEMAAAVITKEKKITEKKVEKKEMPFIVDKVRKNHCIRKRK